MRHPQRETLFATFMERVLAVTLPNITDTTHAKVPPSHLASTHTHTDGRAARAQLDLTQADSHSPVRTNPRRHAALHSVDTEVSCTAEAIRTCQLLPSAPRHVTRQLMLVSMKTMPQTRMTSNPVSYLRFYHDLHA